MVRSPQGRDERFESSRRDQFKMNPKKKQDYERGLFNIGLKAALKHKKAKLWAKANSKDHFYLAIKSDIESEIIGECILLLSDDDAEWLNEACAKGERELKAFIKKISDAAYDRITN